MTELHSSPLVEPMPPLLTVESSLSLFSLARYVLSRSLLSLPDLGTG